MGKHEAGDDEVPAAATNTVESALWRLVYVSKAQTPISDEDLDQILRSARLRNFFTLNLTGMLMLVGGSFCQILEGSSENLQEAFERIKADRRHSNVRLLELKPIAERSFAEWSMGPPTRSLKEFSEAADVDEYFRSVRGQTAKPTPEVLSIMTQFHAGALV